MNKSTKILGTGVILAIAIAVMALLSVNASKSLGAVAPTDLTSTNYTQLTASDGLAVGGSNQFQVGSTGALVQGGGVNATTTTGSTVLTYSLMDLENVVSISRIAGNAGGTTNVTLPSASSITKLVNVGDSFRIVVTNATTTANVPLTFVAGGNMQLISASSTANKLVLGSMRSATIDFTLATSTSFVTAFFTPFE